MSSFIFSLALSRIFAARRVGMTSERKIYTEKPPCRGQANSPAKDILLRGGLGQLKLLFLTQLFNTLRDIASAGRLVRIQAKLG